MKRKLSAILVALCLIVTLLPVSATAAAYADTEGHWAESSIDRWSDFGMIQGNNGQFNPNGTLTRAHMATMLCRLLNLPAAGSYGFLDVNADNWFADAVNRCAAAGIMLGNNGYANPNASITREQALVMLCRALGLKEGNVSVLSDYADADQVAPYARGYLAALVEAGILKGDNGRLNPMSNITRAQMVVIVDRIVANYANEEGQTLNVKSGGTVLVVAKNVTVKNAPAGTKIIVAEGVTGLTVNGEKVTAGQTYTVPEATSSDNATSGGSSSGGGGSSHDHTYADSWTYDATHHWHAATCAHTDKKSDYAEHHFTTYTANEDGTHTPTCVCGATKSAEVCTYGTESTNWSGDMPKTFKVCSACEDEVVNSDVYYIANAADLNAFAVFVAEGNTFSGKTVKLTASIDFDGAIFSGIGASTVKGYPSNAFSGTFDAQDYEIKNMTIGNSTEVAMDGEENRASRGFFNTLSGTVKNLKLTNIKVDSTHYAGTVTGYATSGTITSCTVDGATVTSTQWQKENDSYEDGDKVGGIIGYAAGVAVSNNTVKNTSITAFRDLGGIVGCADGAATTVTGNRVEDTTLTLTGATYATIAEIIGRLNGDAAVGADNTTSNVKLNTMVTSSEGLAAALARGGNITIGADITIPVDWQSVSSSHKDITIDGNNKTITGLPDSLLSFFGPGNLSVKDLTFTNVNIEKTNASHSNEGFAALVGYCNFSGGGSVIVENCHVTDSSFDVYQWAGAFVGATDLPQRATSITIKDCSVSNTSFEVEDGSCGAFVGYTCVGVTIEDSDVLGTCSFECSEDRTGKDAKAGSLIGTISHGYFVLTDNEVAETVTVTNKNSSPIAGGLIGRAVNAATLTINGKQYVAEGVMLSSGIYEISTADGLMWFADQVNTKGDSFAGKTVKLMADIDMSGKSWVPVGQPEQFGGAKAQFNGTFDGNNKTVSNLSIPAREGMPGNYATGFFGWLDGTVKNLTISTATVTGSHYVGTIVGYLQSGLIDQCTVENVTINAPHYSDDLCGDKVGGVVGFLGTNATQIKDCTVTNSTITAGRDAGQVVGCAESGSTVTNCTVNNVSVSALESNPCTGANINNTIVGRDQRS